LEDILEYDKVDNKKLRKCAKIARWETFLFSTNKPGCIRLEVQKTAKNNNIQPLNWQKYYIRRHIDDEADISLMSDILLKWKFFLDYYLTNKKIRYLISSSRLFDDQFNEFWMKERAKEWKFDVPNRIKIREERLNYGWILPDLESEESIEDKFMNWEDNSMTKAFEKYKAQWKELKEWWWYIDLEKLENWKLYK
jgi:hypothetical protein